VVASLSGNENTFLRLFLDSLLTADLLILMLLFIN